MLLALDTSTRRMGVALYNGTEVVHEMTWASNFHHTVELAPAIDLALSRAGIGPDGLTAIAIARGPGSFTSLRTGLALAKGMALARRLPLIGVPTLDFLAAGQPLQEVPLAAVLESGRKRVAVGWYTATEDGWLETGPLELHTAQSLSDRLTEPTWVCGELNADLRTLLKRKRKIALLASPAQTQRRPGFLAELAWERWHAGQIDDPITLAPIYLSQEDPASA
ncbi:MAG TPA: tRNA (adenosine(37)-N6)-threonylcarbamoyltransferase complex dimerization subunit type 1 TsaB [Anaerolineales bacterium]|nr:tRNA (adenosine(37)-N6)-threonylcarbamoyltransferase complex dimerization subunit type 1 TsaB [Anaerolineales bacterium]